MSSAKITLIGEIKYCEDQGYDLFGGMSLPEGIDRDLLINTILSKGSDFEVMWSEPHFLISQIGYWSRRNYRTFEKWLRALNIDYEPLYNYDRYEKWTDTGREDRNTTSEYKRTGGNTTTNNLTQTNDLTRTDDLLQSTNTDMTTEQTRSAFDATTYQPLTKETVSGDEDDNTVSNTGTVKDTGTVKNTGTISETLNETDTTTDGGNVDTSNYHDGHLYGNIGIVSSQQMLQMELDVATWNLYEHISDLFLNEFCIPVYI